MTALGPFRERQAGQLSGGMKQKLGLACTLIHPPQLLLLDEASVGVDPISRRELWSIIQQQVVGQKVTVLLSTAYMDEAERCDHVILLHEGEILAQGNPARLAAPLEGHAFVLENIPTAQRNLQSQIAQLPGVVDTVIQGDGLRIVMQQSGPPALPEKLAAYGSAQVGSRATGRRLRQSSLQPESTPSHSAAAAARCDRRRCGSRRGQGSLSLLWPLRCGEECQLLRA